MLKKYLIASIVCLSIASTAYAGVFDFLKPLLFDNQEQTFGDSGTITRLDQWSATTSPITAVTPRVFGKPVFLSGHIQLAETTTPDTPSANSGTIYVADDGLGTSGLFFIDDTGTSIQLGSGGGGGGGCTNLNCLTDVALSSIASSSVLTYNGSQWINLLPNFNSIPGVASTTQGGTNITSYTTGDMIYASATNVLSKLGIGTSGQVLVSNGTIPVWSSDVPTLSGVNTFTGTNSFTNFPTVAGTATTSQQLVNLQTVSNLIQGVGLLKEAVRVGTTANGTLASGFENGVTIDGVVIATGDRILIKDQNDASENGIYIVQVTGAPVRATDYDATDEADRGTSVSVLLGTENAGSLWVQTTDDPVIDTSDLVFQQLPPPTTYTAGDGIILDGTTFKINRLTASGLYFLGGQVGVLVDNLTLASTTDVGLKVKDEGIGATQLATGAVDLSSGDVTGTNPVSKGGTGVTSATDDAVLVGNGSAFELKTLPSCNDISGQHLNYNAASNTWSCGTTSSGGGSSGGSGGGLLTYSESLDTSTTTVSVSNTNVETDVYEVVIPAGRLNTGGVMRYIVTGTYRNNSGANRTLRYRVYYDDILLNDKTTGILGSNGGTQIFEIDGLLIGGTTTSSVIGQLHTNTENGVGSLQSLEDTGRVDNSSVINTGETNNLRITLTHDTANAQTTAIKQVAQLSHINATTSVSATASLTPWTENIDGAGYDLANAGDITAVTFQATGTSASNLPYASSSAIATGRLFVTDTNGTTTIANNTTIGGRLGVGTTTPQSQLSVIGNTNGRMLVGDFGTSNYVGIQLGGGGPMTSGSYNFAGGYTDTALYINRPTGGDIQFRENNGANAQLTIKTSTGNVGIGTNSPSNSLTVDGSTGVLANYYTATGTATSTISGNFQVGGNTGFRIWSSPPTANTAAGTVSIGGTTPDNGLSVTRVGGSSTTFAVFRAASPGAFSRFVAGTGITFDSLDASGNVRHRLDTNGSSWIAPASGDIGLGTITPTARVHVATSTASASSTAKFTNGTTGALITDGFNVGVGADNNNWLWSNENNATIFGNNNLETMRILAGGDVGIATSTPTSKFSVTGDTWLSGDLRLMGSDINGPLSTAGAAYNTTISLGGSAVTGAGGAGGQVLIAGGGDGGGSSTGRTGGNAGNVEICIGGDGDGTSGLNTNNGGAGCTANIASGGAGGEDSTGGAGGSLTLVAGGAAGGGTGTVGNDGTVTIGRTSGAMNAALNINGGLMVGNATGGNKGNGTINVSGDIYKNNTAYTNPDYVFDHYFDGKNDKGYEGLMPLGDLADFIKKNHRLPKIDDGATGMFARQDILLEKVEELTLYVIELQKQIDPNKITVEAKQVTKDYWPYGLIAVQFFIFVVYVIYNERDKCKKLKANNFNC